MRFRLLSLALVGLAIGCSQSDPTSAPPAATGTATAQANTVSFDVPQMH